MQRDCKSLCMKVSAKCFWDICTFLNVIFGTTETATQRFERRFLRDDIFWPFFHHNSEMQSSFVPEEDFCSKFKLLNLLRNFTCANNEGHIAVVTEITWDHCNRIPHSYIPRGDHVWLYSAFHSPSIKVLIAYTKCNQTKSFVSIKCDQVQFLVKSQYWPKLLKGMERQFSSFYEVGGQRLNLMGGEIISQNATW